MARQRLDHVEVAFGEDKPFYSELIRTREKADGTEEKATVRPKTSRRRQVFLLCLPGTFWACQNEGVPMMAGGQTAGPWPQLDDNIQANRSWIVMVMDTGWNGESPTRNDILNSSRCFNWPRNGPSQQAIRIDKIERIQNVGYTYLSNEEIHGNVVNQNTHWGEDHPLLWNTQHFALTLAATILHEHSFAQNLAVLGRIFHLLELSSQKAEFDYFERKQFAYTGGFIAFGILTFGAGAVFCWGMAGFSMVSQTRANHLVNTQRENLGRRLERFQFLLNMTME